MWESGEEAAAIVEAKGLKQISDSSAIEGLVDGIIAGNPGQVAQFKGGNEKILGWFVGQVMKATQGRSEEHTSELQSLMRISYAVFCLKTKNNTGNNKHNTNNERKN